MKPLEPEYWLCGECLNVADMRLWGGTDSTAVCPNCRVTHYDDECSWVEAGTELEMHAAARRERAERE